MQVLSLSSFYNKICYTYKMAWTTLIRKLDKLSIFQVMVPFQKVRHQIFQFSDVNNI
jgi:hypothetical protein